MFCCGLIDSNTPPPSDTVFGWLLLFFLIGGHFNLRLRLGQSLYFLMGHISGPKATPTVKNKIVLHLVLLMMWQACTLCQGGQQRLWWMSFRHVEFLLVSSWFLLGDALNGLHKIQENTCFLPVLLGEGAIPCWKLGYVPCSYCHLVSHYILPQLIRYNMIPTKKTSAHKTQVALVHFQHGNSTLFCYPSIPTIQKRSLPWWSWSPGSSDIAMVK